MNEAVILAGGLGKRLKSIVWDRPKPMADIGGRPFLWYLLKSLEIYEFKKVILAVGYMKEQIINYFGNRFGRIELIYSEEDKPLGTGGALKKAINLVTDTVFVLLNGDTIFKINFKEFFNFHRKCNADITIALKEMKDSERYGTVLLDRNCRVIQFLEKEKKESGLINGGVYLIEKEKILSLLNRFDREVFSFEKDVLERGLQELKVYGKVFDGYFIDIGIPEDYKRVLHELPELFKIEYGHFLDKDLGYC